MPPDPQIVRLVTSRLASGSVSLVLDEVGGRVRRASRASSTATTTTLSRDPVGVEIEVDTALDSLEHTPIALTPAPAPPALVPMDLAALPSLDEARLGQTIGTGVDPDVEPLPEDLFAAVVGLDVEKRTLRTVVTADRQIHAVLVGEPGTAKSLLLDELRRLPNSRYVVGRTISNAGLQEMFLDSDTPPHLLLIDEIDKTDLDVQGGVLLTLMTGKVTRAVKGSQREEDVDVRVVAAANSVQKVHPALRSRMIELDLPAYSEQERHKVITGFLTTRHGLDDAQAKEIADLVAPASSDVRDAEQIAAVAANDPKLARELAGRLRARHRAAQHRIVDKRGRR